jgi:phosphoribosylcarboxyaminoimidazole (NCAIR) mutase
MSKVAVIMGVSQICPETIEILRFDIEIEVDIVSAHRTPEKLFDFSKMHTHVDLGNYCRCWRSSSPAWYGSQCHHFL